MRYAFLILSLGGVLPVLAQTPADSVAWQRFFPSQIGNRWDYAYTWQGRCGPNLCTSHGYYIYEVIADTLIGERRYPVFDVRGGASGRCAVGVEPDSLWFTGFPVNGFGFSCPIHFNQYWETARPDSYIFARDRLFDPVYVYVGSDAYLADAVFDVGTWYGMHSFAADLGLYRVEVSNGGMGSAKIQQSWVLQYAVVGGVVYGNPLVEVEEEPADPRASALDVWPSPMNGRGFARLTLARAMSLRLEVVDLLGHVVLVDDLGVQPVGVSTHAFDTSALAAGVYVLRAVTPEGVTTRRFVQAR